MKKIATGTETSFGETLKALRNHEGLSRRVLAQRLGIHHRTLENWERGDVLPDRARVSELIHALALSRAEEQNLLEAYTAIGSLFRSIICPLDAIPTLPVVRPF